MYQFVSTIKERGDFKADFSQEIVKNELMFFNCDLDFAYHNGGPITKAFIDNLPADWKTSNPVLDSRVHMLMKGWFPAIPGFHHDDVPRNTHDGQPNYDSPEYYSEHLTGLVNGEICPTLFALGKHKLPKVTEGVIYKQWHVEVEKQLASGLLNKFSCSSGKYIEFDWQSMHTTTRAVASGWRWFIRLSKNTERQAKITNEIRRQVQVYLEFPMEGW